MENLDIVFPSPTIEGCCIYQASRTKILSSLNFLALSKVTFISLSLFLYMYIKYIYTYIFISIYLSIYIYIYIYTWHPQSCPTLCHPMDCSLPGSSVHGISQARILECVAISSSRDRTWPRDWTHIYCISCIAGGFFTLEPAGKLKYYTSLSIYLYNIISLYIYINIYVTNE